MIVNNHNNDNNNNNDHYLMSQLMIKVSPIHKTTKITTVSLYNYLFTDR